MLYYPRVQVFPMLILRKDICFAQERSENIYNARPSHEFVCGEGLDQITVDKMSENVTPLCGKRTVALPTFQAVGQQITGASCRTVRCRVGREPHSKQCVRGPLGDVKFDESAGDGKHETYCLALSIDILFDGWRLPNFVVVFCDL
jgi:hypothetical protein